MPRKHRTKSLHEPTAYSVSIPRDVHSLAKQLAPKDRLGRQTVSGMIRSVLESRFSDGAQGPLPITDSTAEDRVRSIVFLTPAFMRRVQHECERQHGADKSRDKRQSVTNRVIVALLSEAVREKSSAA